MELRLHEEAKAKWDSVPPKFAVTDCSVLPNPLVLVTRVKAFPLLPRAKRPTRIVVRGAYIQRKKKIYFKSLGISGLRENI